MKVTFFGNEMEIGGAHLGSDLRDSNDILHNGDALRSRLDVDGYLLLRKLRRPETVLAARRSVLEQMQAEDLLLPGSELLDGIVNPASKRTNTTGVRANELYRQLPGVQALFQPEPEQNPVLQLFTTMLGGEAGSFDFQWMRVAGAGAESSIHSDIVFMGRGTQQLYTCWTPLGDVTLDMGPIVLCLGSQRIAALEDTYWKADVDRDLIEGHFSKDPVELVERFGCRWATSEFHAGDVLIFGMHILHASLANTSKRYRLSADTRYQLACEPFDERWKLPHLRKHYAFWDPASKLEPAAISRQRWGI